MKILIVDDQIGIRNYISNCFQQLGFTNITEAINGDEALKISKNQLPELITLDWNMPLMNGLDYLKALRALPDGGKPIVIFCSTEGRQKKIDEVMAAGANAYVVKPVDLKKLRAELVILKLL